MPRPAQRLQLTLSIDKVVHTDCVCSGAHCAAVGGFAALRMRRPLYGERAPCTGELNRRRALVHLALPCRVIARSEATWQSRSTRPHRGKAIGENATAFPRFPRRFAPRNDKSDSFALPNYCCNSCDCQWRSLSAATDAIGFYVFIGTLYELQVPSRDCHVASLLAMTIRKCIPF